MNKKISLKTGTMNILNGISMGVVVALIPSALVGQLMKALMGVMPHVASQVISITSLLQVCYLQWLDSVWDISLK